MTIKEILASPDSRGESFNLDAIENGFMVKFSYRQRPEAKKDEAQDWSWSYKSKTYVFNSWVEAVKFIGDNELPLPPK